MPDEEQERVFGDLLKAVNEVGRLDLSDSDWMSIISRQRDGLPPCCGNISALRDRLTAIAGDDGELQFMHRLDLARTITWCFPSHPVPSEAMQAILDQLGYPVPEEDRHMPDKWERH